MATSSLSLSLPESCSVFSTHLRVDLSNGPGSFFIDKKSLPHHMAAKKEGRGRARGPVALLGASELRPSSHPFQSLRTGSSEPVILRHEREILLCWDREQTTRWTGERSCLEKEVLFGGCTVNETDNMEF